MAVLTLTFEADLTSPRFVNHISVYVYLNAGLNTLLSCGIKYLRGS
jgi:hypothetical protein